MDSLTGTRWISGWTAQDPAKLGHFSVGPNDGIWQLSAQAALEVRDLGLSDASNRKLSAQHIRGIGREAGGGDWHCYDLDFEFFYVIKGSLALENQEGQVQELGEGGAVYHPGFYFHRDISRSGDLEVVRITSPAGGARIDGRATILPERVAELPADRVGVYTHESDESYELGTPPRQAFRYRDLATRAPTADRIQLGVVRAIEPGAGTGWHYHSAALWFMVLAGEACIRVEDSRARDLVAGDSICVGAGNHMRHNIGPVSRDYAALEMCVPAVYETIAVGAPIDADKPPEGARE